MTSLGSSTVGRACLGFTARGPGQTVPTDRPALTRGCAPSWRAGSPGRSAAAPVASAARGPRPGSR